MTSRKYRVNSRVDVAPFSLPSNLANIYCSNLFLQFIIRWDSNGSRVVATVLSGFIVKWQNTTVV